MEVSDSEIRSSTCTKTEEMGYICDFYIRYRYSISVSNFHYFSPPPLSKPMLGQKSQPSLARSPCPAIEVTGPACWVTKCGERTHPNSFVAENLCFAQVLNSQPACCHPSASLTTHLAGDMKRRRRWDRTSVGSAQDTVRNGLTYRAGTPDSMFIALAPHCI